eukprot:TRINITY_DN11571_c0_g2_i1.p1 TRINITY_DN11571_c0_g2~~TRINITY_DN11571_c0_g2_i1.p1  ORF type:complete len:368 (+),score=55.82 TRINITY_DN11571_c0_g2_i1:496-1599(+)
MCIVTSVNSSTLTCRVPPPTNIAQARAKVQATITISGKLQIVSGWLAYQEASASSFTPEHGRSGTTVTVFGWVGSSECRATSVHLAGYSAQIIEIAPIGQLTVRVPVLPNSAGAISGGITVQTEYCGPLLTTQSFTFECTPGYVRLGTGCSACIVGTYEALGVCQSCPEMQLSLPGSVACTASSSVTTESPVMLSIGPEMTVRRVLLVSHVHSAARITLTASGAPATMYIRSLRGTQSCVTSHGCDVLLPVTVDDIVVLGISSASYTEVNLVVTFTYNGSIVPIVVACVVTALVIAAIILVVLIARHVYQRRRNGEEVTHVALREEVELSDVVVRQHVQQEDEVAPEKEITAVFDPHLENDPLTAKE